MKITQHSHLNTGPFENQTTFDHLNTRLVRYSTSLVFRWLMYFILFPMPTGDKPKKRKNCNTKQKFQYFFETFLMFKDIKLPF